MTGLRLTVRYESGELEAYEGDLVMDVGGRLWVSHEDLFDLFAEVRADAPLPEAVWVMEPDGSMNRTKTSVLPWAVGGNRVLGYHVESPHRPHGVRGFFIDFYAERDAAQEARLLAPRVAKLLGFDHALGMTRLVPTAGGVEPGTLERFWFTLCDEHGYALKEEK